MQVEIADEQLLCTAPVMLQEFDLASFALEDGAEGVERIAFDCGFGNAERMRRSFLRRLGVSPHDYRRRFQRQGPE